MYFLKAVVFSATRFLIQRRLFLIYSEPMFAFRLSWEDTGDQPSLWWHRHSCIFLGDIVVLTDNERLTQCKQPHSTTFRPQTCCGCLLFILSLWTCCGCLLFIFKFNFNHDFLSQKLKPANRQANRKTLDLAAEVKRKGKRKSF